MKKLVAVLLSVLFVISLASCGAKIEQDTAQAEVTEASETGTIEELTAEETASVTEPETENETEETTQAKKIYLDGEDKDFDDLLSIMGCFAYFTCWAKGYDSNNSSFSDDVPAVIQIIDFLYGTENNTDKPVISRDFPGLISYTYDYDIDIRNENRKDFDPLFKFEDYDNNSRFYYSADADTVEWVEKELLGGSADRNNLIKNEDNDIYCYYCDGRYYFQIWIRNGRGPELSLKNTEQLEDGRYSLTYTLNSYGTIVSFTSVGGIIEIDGKRYWKIFTIDWNLNDL